MTQKIRYLSANSINRNDWDEGIKSSCNRRIYAMSFFLDIFSPRWEALILDEGRALMPVTRNRKFGISYVYQPIFVQQLGCFYRDDSDAGILPFFVDKLSENFRFIDISLNEMNNLDPSVFSVTGMDNYLLPMEGGYDSISGNYNANTRRNIMKAERLGAEHIRYHSPSSTIRMFAGNAGKLYPGIRKVNYERLLCLLERAATEGFADVRAVRAGNGDIIASACFLKDFERFVFYFSANTEEGRRQGAMFFLIDGFIREHAGTRMLLDFNGSVNPKMARFYKGFGAKRNTYQHLKINRLAFPLNYLK